MKILNRIYEKSELTFAILWIVVYVVLSSLADQVSADLGVVKSVTAALHIVMTIILYCWVVKNNLNEKYGFGMPKEPAGKFLYYIPLAIIASTPLWQGFGMKYNLSGTMCYIVSMLCVGFLEEIIFRGLLFRAMAKDGLMSAVIVSSLTFGIGHIVNLFNGSGAKTAGTLVQILFAVLIGLALVLILLKGGSLVPCIVFHSINNALHCFGKEGVFTPQTEMILNIGLIVVVLGGYILYLWKDAFAKQ